MKPTSSVEHHMPCGSHSCERRSSSSFPSTSPVPNPLKQSQCTKEEDKKALAQHSRATHCSTPSCNRLRPIGKPWLGVLNGSTWTSTMIWSFGLTTLSGLHRTASAFKSRSGISRGTSEDRLRRQTKQPQDHGQSSSASTEQAFSWNRYSEDHHKRKRRQQHGPRL